MMLTLYTPPPMLSPVYCRDIEEVDATTIQYLADWHSCFGLISEGKHPINGGALKRLSKEQLLEWDVAAVKDILRGCSKQKPAEERKQSTPELIEQVRLARKGGMSWGVLSKRMKIASSTLRDWVKTAPRIAGNATPQG